MFTVKLLLKAELDLAESCQWYEEKQIGLGKRFYNAVDAKLNLIGKNPLHYNIRFSELYRFAPVDDFPFLIAYRIEENFIYVISIFHTSRDPSIF